MVCRACPGMVRGPATVHVFPKGLASRFIRRFYLYRAIVIYTLDFVLPFQRGGQYGGLQPLGGA